MKKRDIISVFFTEILEPLLIALAITIVIYGFLAFPSTVIGHSMDRTLANGENLIVDKISYLFQEPKRGDIIVFQYSPTQYLVKRIIGLPGERIELINGFVYINGERLDETLY